MDYLSVAEFAARLGVHRTAINKRINGDPKAGIKPSIKAKKVGKYYCIPASELNKWNVRKVDPAKPRTKKLFPKK